MMVEKFEFHPYRWLKDPRVNLLRLDEQGVAMKLLCLMWEEPLRDDNRRVAAALGIGYQLWHRMRKSLVGPDKLIQSDGDWLTNDDILAELERARKKSEQTKRAGLASSRKREQNRALRKSENSTEMAPITELNQEKANKINGSTSTNVATNVEKGEKVRRVINLHDYFKKKLNKINGRSSTNVATNVAVVEKPANYVDLDAFLDDFNPLNQEKANEINGSTSTDVATNVQPTPYRGLSNWRGEFLNTRVEEKKERKTPYGGKKKERKEEMAALSGSPPMDPTANGPPPAKPKRKTGTRLPADWELSAELRAYCEITRPELLADIVAADFADYWWAATGQSATKLDWDRTFQRWVRNQRKTPTNTRGNDDAKTFNPANETFYRRTQLEKALTRWNQLNIGRKIDFETVGREPPECLFGTATLGDVEAREAAYQLAYDELVEPKDVGPVSGAMDWSGTTVDGECIRF